MPTPNENLGPAERIIQTLLTYQDHLYHGRPGIVTAAPTRTPPVQWQPVTHKVEGAQKVVYRLDKIGKKTNRTRLGVITEAAGSVHLIRADAGPNHPIVGEYRDAGLFPEVVAWVYRQVVEVYKLDNEFAAKWASYAFGQEHRDLKAVLCAFMLVQGRKGDPIVDGGKVAFHDDDFRDVGEAMILLSRKDRRHLDAKQLLRIYEILTLPEIAQINRELGFGNSARKPFLGRWPKAVEKWLRYREENPKLLDGLVKAGYKSTVKELAQRIGYKPNAAHFFTTLGWKQAQSKMGHRTFLIGQQLTKAETWTGKTERQICQAIVKDKPDWKRIVGMLPKEVGVTRAIVAAAVEAGGLSHKDLTVLTPTLEELGLLDVVAIKTRWEAALRHANDMRAANIARNVRTKEVAEQLVAASDAALQKQVAEAVKDFRVYILVDISGSMTASIEHAKALLARFVQAFPLDRLHVVVFNTAARVVTIKHASAAGVAQAFHGIAASGGTSHGVGANALAAFKPKADEDTILIVVGDGGEVRDFSPNITNAGIRPLAFGFVQLPGDFGDAVTRTAAALRIPCFMIDAKTFEDPYAIPRTIRNLIAATPLDATPRAQATPRVTLVDTILKTALLTKPEWA